MAVELAAAYVSLIPSAKGMGAAIGKELGGPVEQAAADSGKKAGGILSGALGKAAAIGGGLFAAVKVKDFLGSTIDAARESNKVAAQTEAVIKSTGAAAQLTAGQFSDLATQISNTTGVDDEAIQSAENLLATFTNIKGGVFKDATQTIVDMSAALGQDMSSSAVQLGKALNDPVKGITALQRVGVSFTQQQRDQINAMVEAGDVAGAQKLILAELGKEFGGSAKAQATAADRLKVTLGNLQEDLGNKLIPIVDKAAKFLADNLPGALDKTGKAFGAVQKFVAPIVAAIGKVFGAFKALTGDDGPQAFGEIMDNALGNSGKYVDFFRSLGEAILKVADFVKSNLKPILIGLAAALVLITSPVTAVIAGLVLLYVKFKPVRDVVQAVGESLADFAKFARKMAPQVQEAFGHIVHAAEVLWGMFGDNVLTVVRSVFRQFQNIVETVVRVVRDVIQVVVAIINGDWGKAWAAFKDIPSAVIGFIVDTIKNLGPLLGAALGAVGETLVRGFEAAWAKVTDFAPKVPGMILDALGDAASWLVDVGGDAIRGLLAGIVAVWAAEIKGVLTISKWILDAIGDAAQWLVDVGGKAIRGLYNGLRAVWDREVRGLLNISRWILDAIGDAGRWLYAKGGDAIRGLYNGLKWVWDHEVKGLVNISQWLVNAGTGTFEMGKKLFGWVWDGLRWAINKVIGAWNSLDFTIGGFSLFGKHFGGVTIGVPDIPLIKAANGFDGVVTRPTMFLAAEAGAAERVTIGPANSGGAPLVGGDLVLQTNGDAEDSMTLAVHHLRRLQLLAG